MEKHLQRLRIFLVFTLIFCCGALGAGGVLFAQTPSIVRHIRFPIWAEVDAYPGTQAAVDDVGAEEFSYPIARIKETVPFLIEGLVYGWRFTYVPSDKIRGVEEYFEIVPVPGQIKMREELKEIKFREFVHDGLPMILHKHEIDSGLGSW